MEGVAVRFGKPPLEKGDREIPLGRWSYHPKGYFIRYFPSRYTRTRIQLYVPEHFTIRRDQENRITGISDDLGNRIETEYDDQIEPLTMPGDSGVKAHTFSSIRFVYPRAIGPEMVVIKNAKWENVGWALVGAPSGKGRVDSSSDRFPGLGQRYQRAQRLAEEVANLIEQVSKLRGRKGGKRVSKGVSRDVVDLSHYEMALKAAVGGSLKNREGWASDHLHLAKKAWQDALRRLLGSTRSGVPRERPFLLASTSLTGILLASSGDPCDTPPEDQDDSEEHDPSDGSATPGSTGSQRVLPSGADADSGESDPDCDQVKSLKNELEKIRDAFRNNTPQQGEDGFEYAKRIQGMFGYGESGGAFAPMETTPNCVIRVNEAYYRDKPSVIREADCAHEKVHQAKCRWARNHAAGGYIGWMTNPWNYRQNEMDAYAAGIKELEDWMAKNGCE
jgi:hypothetical protein